MTDTAASSPGDDALVAELRRVAALADPVPHRWHEAATSSFAWVAIDAVPAHLAYDSRSARGGRVGGALPSGSAPREVRYVAGPLAIELELDVGADKLRVLGRVTPSTRVDVVAAWPEGRREATSDDSGTFRFAELPRRPLSVYVAGAHAIKTGWIVT